MWSVAEGGRQLGEFVLRDAAAKRKPSLTIAFFPGPINSSWAPESLKGFLSVVRDFPGELRILPPAWGTPQPSTQRELVAQVLETHPTIDYVIGNAVAAAAAANLLQAIGRTHDTSVLSAYYSPMIERPLASGAIAAVAWERAEGIGRIAVDLMVRTLEGAQPGRDIPFRIGPRIQLIDSSDDVGPVLCH
jgi:protein TorT